MPDPDKSARSRRRAPVIELKAQEIPVAETPPEVVATVEAIVAGDPPVVEAAPVQEPKITEPQPEPQPEPLIIPPPPPPKPSLGVPLTIAAVVGALFGGLGGTIVSKLFGGGAGEAGQLL
jgi:hypothetical protein